MMKKYLFVILAPLILLCACNSFKVRINGRFAGNGERIVTLERVLPSESIIIDSAVTDDKGAFRFKVELPGGEATLYNLRCQSESVTLLLAPGDNVKFSSLAGIRGSYTVEGSDESLLVKEIKAILSDGAGRLDSIMNTYSMESIDPDQRKSAAQNYMKEYYDIKRNHIKFIVEHAGSLAAVYALYQRLPNDDVLFNGENDVVYYRMVADSVEQKYPTSPYLKTLKNSIASFDSAVELNKRIEESLQNPASFPDIEMADMYGKKHKLSDLSGKVILIDVWVSTQEGANLLNAELKELYDEYHAEGLEIYQVSIDTSKPQWVMAVQDQRLPWISVCDFKGTQTQVLKNYAVSTIPATFLIDREGNIVARDLFGDDLRREVSKLMNK